MNILWVEVRDGKGGYAREHVSISTSTWQPVFGGRVADRATGRPVADAVITINGARVISAADGSFAIAGRGKDYRAQTGLELTSRYVVNVR